MQDAKSYRPGVVFDGNDLRIGTGPPRHEIPVPSGLRSVVGGARTRAVWVNQIGGVTFELTGDGRRRFLKWAPAGSGLDLSAEAARMQWVSAFAVVPRVVEYGDDADGSWLLTEALAGESAVANRGKVDPATAVAAIGVGLRRLHDSAPVEQCPFTWSAQERLARAHVHAEQGRLDPNAWHREHRHLSVEQALNALAEPPHVDGAVVCHADACSPNTIVADDGSFAGHVDLGSLGVADRWADLAIATWSATWNYGAGWEEHLLDAYGIAADQERTCYYRLLWDLT